MSRSVVVIVGGQVDPSEIVVSTLGGPLLGTRVSEALGTEAHVALVGWTGTLEDIGTTAVVPVTTTAPFLDRLLSTAGIPVIHRLLHRSPVGRLLNSLGPLDPSRVFWRRVVRSPDAISAITAADIVIAADIAAVRTAWIMLHRGSVDIGLFGIVGALRWLQADASSNRGAGPRRVRSTRGGRE